MYMSTVFPLLDAGLKKLYHLHCTKLYQIDAGSLINAGGTAYPHGTFYGDKEESVCCNNVVELAEKTSKEAAARQLDVDSQRISKWCGQK